jgi:hypothetical protein
MRHHETADKDFYFEGLLSGALSLTHDMGVAELGNH